MGRVFEPIERRPGELIRSEDWNKMQRDIQADLAYLESLIEQLKTYIENMGETTTITNLESPEGSSYRLDEEVPGETDSFRLPVIGLITRQWVAVGSGPICKFGVVDTFVSLDFWATARNGDREVLEVVFEYIDGTSAVMGPLYIHEMTRLRPKGAANPYLEYLLAPNEWVWYRYRINNPNPEKEVLSLGFRNVSADSTVRVGNVLHYRSKIRPLGEG